MLVTAGATEGIASVVLALCEPGDEVVTFEPYYDSYAATIALAGAVRRTSVLRFPSFEVDEASLRAAFSARTRLVLLNSPHNPTGKVFSRAELELICALAREYDAWVVTDEVYEHLTFDGVAHVPVATLPGMWERTISISSSGKTFSATGWKVGWVTGPAPAVAAARTVKQFLTYVASGPFQPAVALALGLDDSVYAGLAASLERKRDLLCAGLVGGRDDGVAAVGDVLRRGRRGGAGSDRRAGVLSRAPVAVRGGRGPGVGVPRRRGGGAHVGPVRVLQEGRGADRGGVPAGDVEGPRGGRRLAGWRWTHRSFVHRV